MCGPEDEMVTGLGAWDTTVTVDQSPFGRWLT